MRGKRVLSQLYKHVRMQKSGRKWNAGVRKAVSVPSSSSGMAREGMERPETTPHRRRKYLFYRFSA